MNNILENKLNEYREYLNELSNKDLLFEYKFACMELARLAKLVKCTDCGLRLDNQKFLDAEKQREKICKDIIINRMGGN